jgi:ATP sulfurylase
VGVYKPNGECVEVEPSSIFRVLGKDHASLGRYLYTVERVLKRRPKGKSAKEIKVLGRVEGVYCDQVGEVAYYASCYKNVPFGQEVSAVMITKRGKRVRARCNSRRYSPNCMDKRKCLVGRY